MTKNPLFFCAKQRKRIFCNFPLYFANVVVYNEVIPKKRG